MHKALVDLHEELRLLDYQLPAAETKARNVTVNNDIEAIDLKIRKAEWKLAEHQSFLKR